MNSEMGANYSDFLDCLEVPTQDKGDFRHSRLLHGVRGSVLVAATARMGANPYPLLHCISQLILRLLEEWAEMGYLFGQKRRKVGRLQRQAARCFLVTQEASSVELGTWCWPRVVLIEKRPLTESERSSMNRAARSFGARRIRRLGRNNWIWRLSDDVAARWR